MSRLVIALAAPLALVACAEEPPAPEETPTPMATGPRTLVAAGFNDQQLGPKIVGPQGPEVVDEISFEGMPVAKIVSYVACPAPSEGEPAADECKPGEQPDGAIFTYVHKVTSTGADTEAQPFSFRTTKPVTGFANNIGFDRKQAEAALGEDYVIGVQNDNGALVWRIEAGDGWGEGEEITFFWQSTLPPAGPAEAYEIETNTGTAVLTGPFPPEEEPEEAGDEAAAG